MEASDRAWLPLQGRRDGQSDCNVYTYEKLLLLLLLMLDPYRLFLAHAI